MTLQDTINIIANFVSSVGIIVGVCSLIFAACSLRVAARNLGLASDTAKARFLLDLRSHFHNCYHQVHVALRPGGDYHGNSPKVAVDMWDWPLIDGYMGTFSVCETMLRSKLLDEHHFFSVYRYRIHNIMANQQIQDLKLNSQWEGHYWQLFRDLNKRLKCYEAAL